MTATIDDSATHSQIEYRAWHRTEHVMGLLKVMSWDENGKFIGGFLVGAKPGENQESEDHIVLAPSDGRFCRVEELVVMAFIGNCDKNGQRIFNGDVLQYHMCHHYANRGVVVWEDDHYAVRAKRQVGGDGEDSIILFGYDDHEVSPDECEVISNVWQQPELGGAA